MSTTRWGTALKRSSILMLLVVIALLSGTGAAYACVCIRPENREAAAEQLSRFDVVFDGTVVRTLPGTVVYAVTEVYAGDVSERVLVSAAPGGTSCDAGTPPRGASEMFFGTSQTGIIRAPEGAMCIGVTEFMDGDSASLSELAAEAHGPAHPPSTTLGSRTLALAEWPLTWLSDRRVLAGIALLAVLAYAVHYFRSRYGEPR